MVRACLEEWLNMGELSSEDVIVWDSSTIHDSKATRETLSLYNLVACMIPGPVHHFLLPNDAGLHGELKGRWRHLIWNGEQYTWKKKYIDLDRAWSLVTPTQIRHIFCRCMIGPGEECKFTEPKLDKLLSEGRLGASWTARQTLTKLKNAIPSYRRFVHFFVGNNGEEDPVERPQSTNAQTLDGIYWATYRPPTPASSE